MSHEAPTQNVSQSQRCQRLVAVIPSTSPSHTLLRATSCGFVLHQRGLATSSIHRCWPLHVLNSTTSHVSIRCGGHRLCSPTDFTTNSELLEMCHNSRKPRTDNTLTLCPRHDDSLRASGPHTPPESSVTVDGTCAAISCQFFRSATFAKISRNDT